MVGAWRRTSPLSILANMTRGIFNALIPIGAVLYGSSGGKSGDVLIWVVVPLALTILGVAVVGNWLEWSRLRYRIGEHDVKLEHGIFSRKARSVPYDRIQDVSLEQKLIPRLLGLVEVRFETGAGGKDELKLAYVSEAEGEALRETVRAMAEGDGLIAAEQSAAPQAAPEAPARVLFAMGPRRLFTFGLFEFSLAVFAVLAAASQQLEFLLPFEIWDVRSWGEQLEGPAGWAADLGFAAQVIAAATGLFGLILVGLITGLARTFLRDYGFVLERTAKGFRRRRGLLTKTDVVMPAHRVQALIISTAIVRRRWGWHGLSFISLAQDAGAANHEVAPFAQMQEIEPIISEAGFSLPLAGAQWQRPSADYYWLRVIIQLGVVGIVAVALAIWGPVLAALAAALLALVLALREYWLWRHDRHALDPQQVISRKGWLAPRLVIANRVKLHSVSLTRGPLARWRGYADLHFGLAGGKLSFSGLQLADAERLRDAALESIAAVDFSRLPR